MRQKFARVLFEITFLAVILVVVDLLPVPGIWVALIGISAWAGSLLVTPVEKILLLGSFTISLALVNEVAPRFMKGVYYREHELLEEDFSSGFQRYRGNREVKIEKSHGDLLSLGFRHPLIESLREEREIYFRTDSWGYRDYMGGRDLVLLGGAFVAGNGNTQADNLSHFLFQMGIQAYNLGHTGNIGEYLRALSYARKEMGLTSPAILFAFEGTDFANINYCVREEPSEGLLHLLHQRIRQTHLASYLTLLSNRFRSENRGNDRVEIVAKDGLAPIGFLREYRRIAESTNYEASCLARLFAEAPEKPRAIFFIPEKSRVYSFLFANAPEQLRNSSVYALKLREIAEQNSIDFVDLTDLLRARAQEILPENRFVFWRDDTSWNRIGMAVAAEAVKKRLDAWEGTTFR